MSKRKRIPLISIFIACEGRNTEPIYFEKIKEEIEEENHFSITVYPDKNDEEHSTHAIGLVREAQSRIDDFDEVWVVFDKNGYTKHKEAFDLANESINGKIVNVAFSSISFEQWILLHFEKSPTAFSKSWDVIQCLVNNNYFPGYEKKAYIDTYTQLKNKTWVAIENSAWLKFHLSDTGQLPGNPIYQLNPYTDVERLVMRLLRIEENVIWRITDQTIQIGQVEFIINVANNSIIVRIQNNSGLTLVYNQVNISEHFKLFDESRQLNEIELTQTTVIQQNENKTLLINALNNPAGNTLICIAAKTICMVGLW